MTKVEKMMEKWQWPFAIIAMLIVFLVFSLLAALLPFDPVRVEEFRVLPANVCRGDFVEFYMYQDAPTQWWYSYGQADGFVYWVEENDPRPYRSTYFEFSGSIFNDDAIQHPRRRFAPETVGTWKAAMDITVHGYIFGYVPTSQTITLESDNWIDVESCTNDGYGGNDIE